MASKEDKKKARGYMGRSLPRTLSAIGRDWGAIIGLTCLGVWLDSWWLYVPIVWLIGAFQFAVSESLLHEASHYNLAKSRKLNDALEIFYGLPFLQTVQQFRDEHLTHHTKFGKADDHLVEDYELWGFHKPGRNMFWLIIAKPILGWAAWFYVSWLSLKPWKQGMKLILFWAITVGAFWYFGALEVLALYWVVPMLWCRYTFLYWSEVGDHYNTETGMRSTLGKGYNWMFHNNGYHAVHHEFPTIPFYRLREAYYGLEFIKTDTSKSLWNTFEQIREPLPLPSEEEGGLVQENYRLGREEFRDKAANSE